VLTRPGDGRREGLIQLGHGDLRGAGEEKLMHRIGKTSKAREETTPLMVFQFFHLGGSRMVIRMYTSNWESLGSSYGVSSDSVVGDNLRDYW